MTSPSVLKWFALIAFWFVDFLKKIISYKSVRYIHQSIHILQEISQKCFPIHNPPKRNILFASPTCKLPRRNTHQPLTHHHPFLKTPIETSVNQHIHSCKNTQIPNTSRTPQVNHTIRRHSQTKCKANITFTVEPVNFPNPTSISSRGDPQQYSITPSIYSTSFLTLPNFHRICVLLSIG